MTLTLADQTYIQNTVVRAIEQLILPRFDDIDTEIAKMKIEIAELKDDVRILKDEMRQVNSRLIDIEGRLEALEADVKELYFMQKKQQNAALTDKKFAKLPIEAKIRIIDREVVAMAKSTGVKLIRP